MTDQEKLEKIVDNIWTIKLAKRFCVLIPFGIIYMLYPFENNVNVFLLASIVVLMGFIVITRKEKQIDSDNVTLLNAVISERARKEYAKMLVDENTKEEQS